jgi:acetyl esterase
MLVYPVTDLANRAASYAENGKGYLLTAATMEFFIDCYTPERSQRLDPRASPLLAPTFVGLPRTLVITAELDPLRDEGEGYARALKAAGVDVALVRYDGAVHGFFQMSKLQRARARRDRALRTLPRGVALSRSVPRVAQQRCCKAKEYGWHRRPRDSSASSKTTCAL